MLLSLGLFAFSIDTLAFDEVARRASWRHATSTRIGARDATQFTGPGEETIALPGTVYNEIADGRVSIDELRRMADTGDAWSLVDGRGYVYETPIKADYALIKALKADEAGNLVYRKTARNFGPIMAAAAAQTIVQVSDVLPRGGLDPEAVVTPGIYVNTIVKV